MPEQRPSSGEFLARLTGVRSSKLSFYNKYRNTSASLDRSVRTLASTSKSLTAISAGPVRLVEEFVPAVAATLDAEWAALAAEHPAFPEQPFVVAGACDGPLTGSAVPSLAHLTGQRDPANVCLPPGQRAVPLHWAEDGWGWLVVQLPLDRGTDDTDAAILATLANHVVAAVQSSHLLAEVSAYAGRLATANEQLRQTRVALDHAREREIVETERQRLARELHDSVAQRVLAIGMALEWCRGVADDDLLRSRLGEAQEMARSTVATIREAIFELSADELSPGGLVASIRAIATQLANDGPVVMVQRVGPQTSLPRATERALLIVAREALFNVMLHSAATRATVRVAYRPDAVVLEVIDDGRGDPEQLSRCLQEALRSRSGYHRGLAFVYGRIRELGGQLTVSAARGGGVRLSVRVPIDPAPGLA
jgi:signal transduction histidine kinase